MKNLLLLIFLVIPMLGFSQSLSLQKSASLSKALPESVGMSSERLARIDNICEKAIEEQDVPGIVALVAKDGKIVYHKAFGKADDNRDLKTTDIFRIASQTKAITSTAVMMLWEEGHFRLDDPISKWIPEFKNPRVLKKFKYSDTTYTSVPADREITIRHLLTHTSGIGYGIIDGDESFKLLYHKAGIKEIASLEPITTAENIKNLAKLPLHFHPGDEYSYSMSLDVLAYFVEIISGVTFDKFLEERIFKPLAMTNTYFYLPKDKENRLVALQYFNDGKWKAQQPFGGYDPNYPITGERTIFSGGGGLSCTTADYATFLQMYLNGGELNGFRLLSRTTIQFMMGNHIGNLWSHGNSHHGLAFGVVTKKGQDKGGDGSEGTFSWGGAFNTQYFADPKQNIIGIIYKQTSGAWKDKTNWQFRQLVGQAVLNTEKEPALKKDEAKNAGMSDERLARIDAICEKALEEDKIPGMVALVARNGKIVYHKAFGQADVANKRPMRKDDMFRIASQTKAITSTAVMMLWEEGHFKLDDPVWWWLPEFKDPKILNKYKYEDNTYTSKKAENQITIRHLLTHTSGIAYGVIDGNEGMRRLYKKAGIQEFAAQKAGYTTAENVKKIGEMPLHFNPGEKYQYGMGLDVLVAFVEKVSGKSFDAFVKERLFEPLGMKDTYFHMPQSKADRLVSVQMKKDGKWIGEPVTSYDPTYPLTGSKKFCSGGAGLTSTVLDYAIFLQMYLNGGKYNGIQILSPTTIKSMMGNHIGDFWGNGSKHYGLAFGVITEKGQERGGEGSEGTFDWGGYFNTSYFADPKEQVIGLIFKQTKHVSDDKTGWQFRQLVFQAIDD